MLHDVEATAQTDRESNAAHPSVVPQEFKREAVHLAQLGDRRLSEVARDLGIRADMLRQGNRQLIQRKRESYE